MRLPAVAIAVALIASPALAADAPPAPLSLIKTTTTSGGEPIALPPGPVEVTAIIAEIGPNATTAVHEHPFLRYGYLLSGRLEISYLDTGEKKTLETGQFFVDPIGRWHQGRALDGKGVKMLIIDQAPPGKSNMVLRDPPPAPTP